MTISPKNPQNPAFQPSRTEKKDGPGDRAVSQKTPFRSKLPLGLAGVLFAPLALGVAFITAGALALGAGTAFTRAVFAFAYGRAITRLASTVLATAMLLSRRRCAAGPGLCAAGAHERMLG